MYLLTFSLCPTGHTEADVYGRQSAGHHQQRSIHRTHHLHHHAGEQRSIVPNHQLLGARLCQCQRKRQRHRPQDCRRVHGSDAAARRLHFYARYVGERNVLKFCHCSFLLGCLDLLFLKAIMFCCCLAD